MTDEPASFTTDALPPRAPQRWFKCVEFMGGLKVELPYPDENAAIVAGIAHLDQNLSGQVKVGYYGFRSRVIVYGMAELSCLRA